MDIIRNISDLRLFFHRNERPIYFISATNFNLLGIDHWVNRFQYINYIDCFDGRHPNVFVPSETPHPEFESIEDINNYLLQHKEVTDLINRRGGKPVATFLMFDEKTEELAQELGLEVWFPSAKLRQRCDNKMETVRIGNKAGVPSVPNALEKVSSWQNLMKIANRAGLGHDLVIQTAFGDSGHTTFFIANEDDFNKHKDEIVGEAEVKIMKRINCRGATLEACATQSGTLVGPLLTEVVGARELTPYKGGWCGNEVFLGAFPDGVREKARDMAFRFGTQLLEEGYRGYFDLDFLIDQDTGEVYLGELNPRICGASSMTNHAAFAYADAPLFLFHLLEFSGVPFELNVAELNERWARPEFIDSWSQVVLKYTATNVDHVTHAPPSGMYRINEDGSAVSYHRFDTNRRAIDSEREGFFLRITGAGDYRYEGADLGILILRGRAMDDQFRLNERVHNWIRGIRQYYGAAPLVAAQIETAPQAGSFKIL
ncbi:biotin carboxylase [Bradyrhizobium sp. BR13661]|jgi:D-alanine-D-alanine ligase-like ATP-grasp enzyme|uniref:biotin carboxylase n=1 Tax=Bradyrhizobium sp. BR13661 TaxID=2940622 RepID=UPI00247722E6|nr:biotin carboxylase [Bradyrhizobium sp. BR13661]MDH6257516.1 D-alanine-D-alanine ligase-like ATP-grasp enzyme [Bradyrhizobium sp. BR13661]